MDLSIVIPVYNEEGNVENLYHSICDALDGGIERFEIVFVDDGSADSTLDILRSIVEEDSRVRVVKMRTNFGQTPAMSAGIQHARGKIIVTMDGDMQNDPRDIPALVARIEEGADIVSGWRLDRHDRLFSRKIPSKIANWIIRKVTGVPIHDTGCALKAYRGELIRSLPLYSDLHRFIPAMSTMATSRFDEIVVRHHPRRHGSSKYGLSRIGKVVLDILTIKMLISFSRRPLHWFGLWSLPIFATSAIVGSYALARTVWAEGQAMVIPAGVTILLAYLAVHLLVAGLFGELVIRAETTQPVKPLECQTGITTSTIEPLNDLL